MFLSFYSMLFSMTLVSGVLMSISSSSWFMVWVGLELNLLSFIPLMVSKSKFSSEAALKYFLIQALSSSFIILSSTTYLISFKISCMMILCALLFKLGAAPFHFWFPQIMEGLPWLQAIILMTVQKMAPLWLVFHLLSFKSSYLMVLISSAMSAIMGSLMGINQTSIRKLIAFSSINHVAWMLMVSTMSEKLLFLYFLFYCMVSSSVVMIFYFKQTFFINQLMDKKNMSNIENMPMYISLLSLGGLPPFTGFIPKWLVIQELVSSNMFIMFIILLSCALITLYYYLRLIIPYMILSFPKLKNSIKVDISSNFKILNSFVIFINSFGLLVPYFCS